MTKFLLKVGIILLLCYGTTGYAQAPNYNIYQSYTPLVMPRSDVPVGARWLPGSGPTGPRAELENLSISEGASSAIFNSSEKARLKLSLAAFFGLDTQQASSLRANFENLSITRVADLTKLGHITSGQQVLYEAVRAGTISISADSGIAAAIKAKAEAEGIAIDGETAIDGGSTIKLNGSDLFIAYKVLQITVGTPKSTKVRHQGGENTLLDTYRFRFCQCRPGEPVTVEVQNLKAVSLNGQIVTKRIKFNPATEYLSEYSLDAYQESDKVTAARVKFNYVAKQECTPMGGVTDPNGNPVRFCGAVEYPKDQNYITLTTSSFNIVPVKDPGSVY